MLTSVLIWLPLEAFEWFRKRMGWKISAENLLIFCSCFGLLGIISWVSKRLFFGGRREMIQATLKNTPKLFPSLDELIPWERFHSVSSSACPQTHPYSPSNSRDSYSMSRASRTVHQKHISMKVTH